MPDFDLKKYLEQVVELEKAVYIQENIIKRLNHQICTLCIPIEIEKPVEKYVEDEDTLGWIILAIVGFILGGINSCACRSCDVNCFSVSFKIIPFLFAIAMIIVAIYKRKEFIEFREYAHYKYLEEVNATEKAREAEKKRLNSEGAKRKKLVKERNLLQKKHIETKKVLESLYGLNVIFQKYRNLVAVCSFYEYIMSGRCDRLDGHEGAYNIFENEIRLNMVISRLEDVIERLDRIEKNQYMLYSAITEGNKMINSLVQKTDQLSSQMNSISSQMEGVERQSAIAAQNNAWAAQELNTIKWIEIMRN